MKKENMLCSNVYSFLSSDSAPEPVYVPAAEDRGTEGLLHGI